MEVSEIRKRIGRVLDQSSFVTVGVARLSRSIYHSRSSSPEELYCSTCLEALPITGDTIYSSPTFCVDSFDIVFFIMLLDGYVLLAYRAFIFRCILGVVAGSKWTKKVNLTYIRAVRVISIIFIFFREDDLNLFAHKRYLLYMLMKVIW